LDGSSAEGRARLGAEKKTETPAAKRT